jgi:hypothetical protein
VVVADPPRPTLAGIPPGSVEAVLTILRASPVPVRRRKLLAELESRGRRISLAGLNRILQHCAESGLTVDGPDGLAIARAVAVPSRPAPPD